MAIGSLAVRVSADTQPYTRGMKETTGPAKKLENQMDAIGKRAAIMAAAITAAGTAITVSLARRGLEAVDAQAKLARQLDGTIDGLRGLQLAGSDAGVDVNTLNKDVEKLTSRLGEAMRGTGEAADALDRLGLNAEELAGMDVDERIATIADRMKELDMSAAEAGDTLRDFGIRNGEIINLMRQGGDAIRNAREEVDRLGLSMSEVDAAKVEKANDAMARIGAVSESLSNKIAVSLAPTLTAFSEQIVREFSDASGSMQDSIDVAVDAAVLGFADILDSAARIVSYIDRAPEAGGFGLMGFLLFGKKGAVIGTAIGAVFAQIREELEAFGIGIGDTEHLLNQQFELTQKIGARVRIIAELEEDIRKIKSSTYELEQLDLLAIQAKEAEIRMQQQAMNGLNEQHARINKELYLAEGAHQRINELMAAEADQANGLADGISRLSEQMRASREVESENSGMANTQTQATEGQDDPSEELSSLVTHQENILDATRSFYEDKLALQHWSVVEEAKIDAAAKAAQQQRDKALFNARLDIASGMFSNLSSLMESEYRKEFEIGKVAAQAKALIDGYQAVQSSYAAGAAVGGPVVGAAFAATAAAATAIQLRKITSTSFSGSGGKTPTAPPSQDPTANAPQSVTNNSTSNNVTLNVTGSGDPQSIITALEEFFGNDGIAINSDTAQAQVLRG